MAVPKRKTTPAKRGMRRAHDQLSRVQLTECDNCGATKRQHHVCSSCGFYRGKQVLVIAAPSNDDEETL